MAKLDLGVAEYCRLAVEKINLARRRKKIQASEKFILQVK